MDRWSEADALLDELLDLPAVEQQQLLDQTCSDDPQLRQLLESLLAADARAASARDEPNLLLPQLDLPDAFAESGKDDTEEGPEEGAFGAYRSLRKLGEGGMGKVYLAQRKHGEYSHQVAIKTLKHTMVGAESRWRFQREQAILARLQHPFIAKLYDSGITSDGLPYLVMEYVEGEPLDRYCDRLFLTIEERLRLFALICDAVHAAHQSLLVHRDIKPSNILITADGTPKLIDFGIAKPLEMNQAESRSDVTRQGAQPFTPKFASPEQLLGQPITTASDVYPLGVILYSLLSGQEPYDLEGLPLVEISRRVAAGPEHSPSQALLRSQTSSQQYPSQQHPRQHIEDDLDRVVAKAMAIDPDQRYGSAGAMARDISLYLRGFPVEAMPESALYRARKWAGRHRLAVAVTLLICVLSILFVSALALANSQTRQARIRAERVSNVLVEMLQPADPTRSQGVETTVGDVLEQGLLQIEKELAGEPEIQADLYQTVARVFHGLGDFEAAADLAKRSLEQRLSLLEAEHPKVADSRFLLGRYQRLLGEYSAAHDQLEEAVRLHSKNTNPARPIAVESQIELATCLRHLGRYDEAWTLLEELPEMAGEALTESPERSARWHDEIGMVHLAKGQVRQAAAAFRQQLVIFRELFQPPHTKLAEGQSQLGLAVEQLGDWSQAAELYRSTVEMEQQILGPAHPEVASSLNNLASVLERQGRYAEARERYQQVLEIDRATLGEDHPYYAISLNNLALLLLNLEGSIVASDLFRKAVAIEIRAYGEGHPETASTLSNLALALGAQGHFEEAEQTLDNALDLLLTEFGPDHRLVGHARFHQAKVSALAGQLAIADSHYRSSLEIIEGTLGKDALDLATIRFGHADLLRRQGKLSQAKLALEAALAVLLAKLPEEHPKIASARLVEAAIALDEQHAEEAEPLVRQALKNLQQASEQSALVSQAQKLLGECLAGRGQEEAALAQLEEALNWARQHQGDASPSALAITASIDRITRGTRH